MVNFKFDKLNINIFIIILLAFPVFKPDSLRYVAPAFDTLFDVFRIIGFIVIVLLFLYRKKRVSKVTILIMLIETWRIFSTVINKGHVSAAVISALSTLLLLFIFECFSEDITSLIKGFLTVFEVLIYASFISILLYFPRGMYTLVTTTTTQYYLLGNKNSIIFYAAPAILLALLNIQTGGSRIRSLLLIVFSYINIFIVWSATSLVAATALLAILLFGKQEFIEKVNIIISFILLSILNVLVVVFRIQEKIPFISKFIEERLGKSLTLTGRSFIWDQAFLLIKAHPLYGYGVGNHIEYRTRFFSGHNQYVNLLIIGGLPLLLLYIVLIIFTLKKIQEYSSNLRLYKAFFAVFICIFLEFFTEGRLSNDFYVLICLACNIDLINDSFISEETRLIKIRVRRKRVQGFS